MDSSLISFSLALFVSFFGGILSFLSPCVLPLIPGYLCFMAGIEFDELAEHHNKRSVIFILPSILAFVGGFSLIFIMLGATATVISPILLQHKGILGQIAGIFIIVLGVHMIGFFELKFLYREWRIPFIVSSNKESRRILSSFCLGLAFAFGWTPCIGPILATILTLAATSQNVQQGIILLSFYAAGLALPFILSALCVGYFLSVSKTLQRYIYLFKKITGSILILTGLLISLGSLQFLAGYLLDWMPILSRFG